ncbi:hypothetical protein ACFX2I_009024 [Malus domestica]
MILGTSPTPHRDPASLGLRLGFEAVDEDVENQFTGVAIRFDAERVEDFRGVVAMEEVPNGTVNGEVDVVLVAAHVLVGGQGRWTINEHGAVLDEGLVGERAVGDEDDGSRADVEGDDGPVLDLEVADAEGYGDKEPGFHGEK